MSNPDSQEEVTQSYIDVVRRYIDSVNNKQLEDILGLFAEDADVHDPAGLRQFRGKEELRNFYTGVIKHARLDITGPIRGSWSNVVATPVLARVPGFEIDVITLTTFDERGLIKHYAAYWGPNNKRPIA